MPLLDILSLGASVLGRSDAKKQAQRNRKESRRQFDAQMDESVQRRVEDARKAGIHPLFALGASVGASPTATFGGEPTGSGIGDALNAIANRYSDRERSEAERNRAEAELLRTERKRLEQDLVSRGRDGAQVRTYPVGAKKGPGLSFSEVEFGPHEFYNPPVPLSKQTGVVAGTLPGTVDVIFPDGRKIRTFSSELEADEIKQFDILYQRAVHKGSDGFMWLRDQLRKIPGVKILAGEHPATKRRTSAKSGRKE